MVWRGGPRFTRCLESVEKTSHLFSRIVLSITSEIDSEDHRLALHFKNAHDNVEAICTGKELPTMQHQEFWVNHLEKTGVKDNDWIYWLAYDDQIYVPGMNDLFGQGSSAYSLEQDTVYFGPWAMRHEQPDRLWQGDESATMESWTSFPQQGPLKLPLITWIADQLKQPTYIQMSGSLIPFRNYVELRDGKPKKTGPMRIEMATAAGKQTKFVQELPRAISMIYGRSNSDRANYGNEARAEDIHLVSRLIKRTRSQPTQVFALVSLLVQQSAQKFAQRILKRPTKNEEWRIRSTESN